MPEVRACVLYRSAGIPARYRVVFRMLENKPLSATVKALSSPIHTRTTRMDAGRTTCTHAPSDGR
jgi:hypothetical protein